jgi:hypothetical protein
VAGVPGDRGAGAGARRGRGGGAGVGRVAGHGGCRGGAGRGPGRAGGAGAGPVAAAGRGPAEGGGRAAGVKAGAGGRAGGGHPRGPGLGGHLVLAVAAGPAPAAGRAGVPVREGRDRADAAPGGLQPAGDGQGPGGAAAPGPGRAVPARRCDDPGVPGGRVPGGQRGRQEEGAARPVSPRRPRVAAGRGPGQGPRPRLPRPGAGQDHPLRGLRHRRQPRVRVRGHELRHRRVRSERAAPVVAAGRRGSSTGCSATSPAPGGPAR